MRVSVPSPARRALSMTFAVTLTVAALTGAPGAAEAVAQTGYLYIANSTDNTVSVVNPALQQPVAVIQVGDEPWAEAATPDGSQIYVADQGSAQVQVISTATNTVTATIAVASGATSIVISADGTRAYVLDRDAAAVSVIDIASEQVVATIAIPLTGTYPKGLPWGIAVSANGKRVYTTSEGGAVTVINAVTDAVIKTLPAGEYAMGIAVSPDGSQLYVTDASPDAQGELTVMNSSTGKVIAQIVVGPSPTDVALSPNGKIAYVVDNEVNMVSEIDTSTDALKATVALAPGGKSWSVAAAAGIAYIPDFGTDSVEEVIPGEAQSFAVGGYTGNGPAAIAVS